MNNTLRQNSIETASQLFAGVFAGNICTQNSSQSLVGPNSITQIIHSYSNGTYYAEGIQVTKRKVVQLIKARG